MTQDTIELRSRITRMYDYYAPEKVCTVDTVLESFDGRQQAIMPALIEKYGPEPTHVPLSAASPTSRLPFRSALFPDSSPVVFGGSRCGSTATSARNSPRPQACGAENGFGVSPGSSYRDRILRLYERYAPEKACNLDTVIALNAGREEILIRALVAKYGPEPDNV